MPTAPAGCDKAAHGRAPATASPLSSGCLPVGATIRRHRLRRPACDSPLGPAGLVWPHAGARTSEGRKGRRPATRLRPTSIKQGASAKTAGVQAALSTLTNGGDAERPHLLHLPTERQTNSAAVCGREPPPWCEQPRRVATARFPASTKLAARARDPTPDKALSEGRQRVSSRCLHNGPPGVRMRPGRWRHVHAHRAYYGLRPLRVLSSC